MTNGIKLSNLSLRDAHDAWSNFENWYIGDLVTGNNTPTAVTIGKFLKNREGYVKIDGGGNLVYRTETNSKKTTVPSTTNLRLQDEGDSIYLQYKNSSNDRENLGSASISDSDTTYTLTLENNEGTNYIKLTDSDGKINSVELPEQSGGGSEINVEQYYAEIIEGSGGGSGSSGGTVDVKVDNNTIVIKNGAISLATGNSVSRPKTTVTPTPGSSFTAIGGIGLDEYGRITSITTKTVTLPTVPTNTSSQDGVVAAGGEHNNMVWKTDSDGVPDWRSETAQIRYAAGTGMDISTVSNNTRTISLADAAKTIYIGRTTKAPAYASLCIDPEDSD